jgi:hypothetical protein
MTREKIIPVAIHRSNGRALEAKKQTKPIYRFQFTRARKFATSVTKRQGFEFQSKYAPA